jgi:hypothetical protein
LDRDIILTDNLHHFPLKPFCVLAGSTVLIAISVCCELVSVLVQCIVANIVVLLTVFKEGIGNVFFD